MSPLLFHANSRFFLAAGAERIRLRSALVALAVAVGGCVACDRGPEPSADAGRALYRENGCASCHGAEGHGDGSVAAALATRPRDFREAAAFTRGADVASIADTIAKGVVELSRRHWPEEEHHNQVMPQFPHLTDSERRSIALYVISFRQAGPGAGTP